VFVFPFFIVVVVVVVDVVVAGVKSREKRGEKNYCENKW